MKLYIRKQSNVTQQQLKETELMLIQCFEAAAKHFDWLDSNEVFRRRVVVTLKCRGQRSNAGADEMNLDMQRWNNSGKVMFEYKSYEHKPDIGGFYSDDPDIVQLGLVAHELAHHLQYGYLLPHLRQSGKVGRYFRMKPHGKEFQEIYRAIRQELINNQDIEPVSRKHTEFVWHTVGKIGNKTLKHYLPVHKLPSNNPVQAKPTAKPVRVITGCTSYDVQPSLFPTLQSPELVADNRVQLTMF